MVNDPNHAAVINQLQINPLRFCPQQAKVPWTKLMHEQMIRRIRSRLSFSQAKVGFTEAVVNDPDHAPVIDQLQMSPLRFCQQQAKVPWTKLMHEQMIRASQVSAIPLATLP